MRSSRSHHRYAALLLVAVLGVAPLAATSCSGSDMAASAPDTSTVGAAPPTLLDGRIDPDSYTEPPDDLKPDPKLFSFGSEVVITDTQFVPLELIAPLGKDVVIRNDTTQVREVEFINGPADETSGALTTGPIPPGGTFTFHPEYQRSLTFRLAGQPDFRGAIYVDVADFEP